MIIISYGALGPFGYLDENKEVVFNIFKGMNWPSFGGASTIDVVLEAKNIPNGLWQLICRFLRSGETLPMSLAGRECRRFVQILRWGDIMYFAVHNDFLYSSPTSVELEIEYNAQGGGIYWVEYDSTDSLYPFEGAYKMTQQVSVDASGLWRTTTFTLPDAYFGNRQKLGLDFILR